MMMKGPVRSSDEDADVDVDRIMYKVPVYFMVKKVGSTTD